MPAPQRKDTGTLCVTFTQASTALRAMYERTVPQLSVDGEEQVVDGWGEHRFPLTVGDHEVRVSVPFASATFGLAQREVTIAAGAETVLHYRAPGTGGEGCLSTPEESTAAEENERTYAIRLMVVVGLLLLACLILRFL